MAGSDKDGNESSPPMWRAQNAAERLIAGIDRGVRAAADVVEAWCRQAALEKELQRLTDTDLADIGISRNLIADVAWSREAPQLLQQMLQKLEIADGILARHPGLRDELARACRSCGARNLCRHWMRREQADNSYRDFCPNESQFAALKKSC